MGSVDDIRRLLDIAVIDILGLENSVGRGRLLVARVLAAAKLVDQGEMEDRVSALEAALGPRLRGGGREKRDRRLDRLMPGLSAKERAILTLRNYKAGRPQDQSIFRSAPDSQANAINRYVGMMNAANGEIGSLILVIRERVIQHELRFQLTRVGTHVRRRDVGARTAVQHQWQRAGDGESEYRQREVEARSEMLPIDECGIVEPEREAPGKPLMVARYGEAERG